MSLHLITVFSVHYCINHWRICWGEFEEFSTLDDLIEQALLYIGCENRDKYDLKALFKSFVLLIWDTRKSKLYGGQDGEISGCSYSCPLTGDLGVSTTAYY